MTGSAPLLLLAAGSRLKWLDVLVLTIFMLGVVLVIVLPFTIDVILSHRTYRQVLTRDPAAAARGDVPHGMQGLARASMAFGGKGLSR